METDCFDDWISIYNNEIAAVWDINKESRKLEMLYCAFQIEFNRIKKCLDLQVSEVRSAEKTKQIKAKLKKFKGLAQSERFTELVQASEKDCDSQLSHGQDEEGFKRFVKSLNLTNCNEVDKVEEPPSPVLRKSSYNKEKRKRLSNSSSVVFNVEAAKHNEQNIPPIYHDDSNILESSIIGATPELPSIKKIKTSRKQKTKATKQTSTLTQMFFEPVKLKKQIDSNMSSMGVTEILNVINHDDDSESDATIDLDVPQPTQTSPIKKLEEKPKFVYHEVVRGKERKNLKGWACEECKDYYEKLNLSPNSLQKKKDQCSKHRYRFQPREETFDGFWDLTFKKTQDSKSIRFDCKKS